MKKSATRTSIVRRGDRLQVGEELSLDDPLGLEGLLEVAKILEPHVGHLDLAEEVHVGVGEEAGGRRDVRDGADLETRVSTRMA